MEHEILKNLDDLPDDYIDFDFMRSGAGFSETAWEESAKHPQNISFYSKLMEFTAFFRFCQDAAAQINIFRLIGEQQYERGLDTEDVVLRPA